MHRGIVEAAAAYNEGKYVCQCCKREEGTGHPIMLTDYVYVPCYPINCCTGDSCVSFITKGKVREGRETW